MKIPSTIKLIGILTDKGIDIYRKQAKNTENQTVFITIRYGQSMKYRIIRHSNTRMVLTDMPEDGSGEFSEIELTMESSYQRDLFALVFQRMNEKYL